jgi:hypothetical protein
MAGIYRWRGGAGSRATGNRAITFAATAMWAPIGFGGRYLLIPFPHDDRPMPFALDDFLVRMLQDLTQDRGRSRLALTQTMTTAIGVSA